MADNQKFSFKMTRIRIKIVDTLIFFFILIQTLVLGAKRILQTYKEEEELLFYTIMASINGIYLTFWLFCTNENSYKSYPQEKNHSQQENRRELQIIRERILSIHSNSNISQEEEEAT
jgi:hypothetical protein